VRKNNYYNINKMEKKEETTRIKWGIDPAHSEIAFKVKHLMITNVKGTFRKFDASVYTSGKDFMTSEIDFTLSPESIDTGDAKRDEHLRSADFFDIDNFKQITFTGDTYEKGDNDGGYILSGDLTMKGIKKQIRLGVEFSGVMKDPWGNEKAAFTVDGKINRKDWGLNWNAALEAGGVLVSDDVKIIGEIQLVRQA
jgi:polyisoprenoid-binding protein YceI